MFHQTDMRFVFKRQKNLARTLEKRNCLEIRRIKRLNDQLWRLLAVLLLIYSPHKEERHIKNYQVLPCVADPNYFFRIRIQLGGSLQIWIRINLSRSFRIWIGILVGSSLDLTIFVDTFSWNFLVKRNHNEHKKIYFCFLIVLLMLKMVTLSRNFSSKRPDPNDKFGSGYRSGSYGQLILVSGSKSNLSGNYGSGQAKSVWDLVRYGSAALS